MIVSIWILVSADGEVNATARRIPNYRLDALRRQGCQVYEAAVSIPTQAAISASVVAVGLPAQYRAELPTIPGEG